MIERKECCKLLSSLSEYIDGDLSAELCQEIERHLSGCDNCQIVVDSLRKTIYLYHATVTPPAVPDDVLERLYHCLDLDDFKT